METFEVLYEKGQLKFKKKPKIKKAKVLVTFFTEQNDQKIDFPHKSLGKLKNIEREELYDEYLSVSPKVK
jgi:hypothetical protein